MTALDPAAAAPTALVSRTPDGLLCQLRPDLTLERGVSR